VCINLPVVSKGCSGRGGGAGERVIEDETFPTTVGDEIPRLL